MNASPKRTMLLLRCLAASIGLHVAALLYVYTHPLSLRTTPHRVLGTASSVDIIEDAHLTERNRELEEAFNQLLVLSPDAKHPFQEVSSSCVVEGPQEERATEPLLPSADLLALPEEHVTEWADFPLPVQDDASSIPPLASLDLSAPRLSLDRYLPNLLPEEEYRSPSSGEAVATAQTGTEVSLPPPPTLSAPAPFSEEGAPFPPLTLTPTEADEEGTAWRRAQMPEMAGSPPLPSLENYYLPLEDPAIILSDAFHIDLQCAERENDQGYLFTASLTPTDKIPLKPLPQHFYFLIDRSNSVQKHRFAVYKRAVLKALSALGEGDTFNILILDKKTARLSASPLPVSRKALQQAEEFLEREAYTGTFAAGDLYAALLHIVSQALSAKEAHTALLLSDGETLLKLDKQKKMLREIIRKNRGKFSLYAAAVGKDNNLPLLDLISTFNRGRLLYSDTYASFPRKFTRLVMDLRQPLILDIDVHAYADAPQASITLTQASKAPPSLHAQQTLVVTGTIDRMADLTFVLKGRHLSDRVSVEKTVAWPAAPKKLTALRKRWAMQEAATCYERFLHTGKASDLKKASAYVPLYHAGTSIKLRAREPRPLGRGGSAAAMFVD
jgi:hypothetical protein